MNFNDNITEIMNSNETIGDINSEFIRYIINLFRTSRENELFKPIID